MLASGRQPVARRADPSRRAETANIFSNSAVRPRRATGPVPEPRAAKVGKATVGAVASAALVGGMSWAATSTAEAAPLGSNRPTLHYGQRNAEVQRLQRELSAYGPNVPATGYFGPITRDRVNRLKSNKGFNTNGLAGPRVWRTLFTDGNFVPAGSKGNSGKHKSGAKPAKHNSSGGSKVGYKQPRLSHGDRGAKVQRLQRELSAYGPNVPATGWYGPITKSRVKAVQGRNGWKKTGVAGFRVWHELFTDGNKVSPKPKRSNNGPSRSYSRPSVPSSNTVWDRLAQCESGGNWQINTGNGFYGGLQFTVSTWRAYGGSGMPHHASRAEQIRVAERTQNGQGWGAWPACSSKLGLR